MLGIFQLMVVLVWMCSGRVLATQLDVESTATLRGNALDLESTKMDAKDLQESFFTSIYDFLKDLHTHKCNGPCTP